jgi:hypothetical protein
MFCYCASQPRDTGWAPFRENIGMSSCPQGGLRQFAAGWRKFENSSGKQDIEKHARGCAAGGPAVECDLRFGLGGVG